MTLFCANNTSKGQQYEIWVAKTVDFLESTAPYLGEGGRCCSVMQSRPELDDNPKVLFLGYNADEDFGYCGIDKERFYKGNVKGGFYDERRYTYQWRIWKKLYDAMDKGAHYNTPMKDGNFIFMNAVYFGSKTIAQLKPVEKVIVNSCLALTNEVIHCIFKPECIVCFSVSKCFDMLASEFSFEQIQEFFPSRKDNPSLISKHRVKMGIWNGIKTIGIPHPSGKVNNDDWGTIALFLKEQMSDIAFQF